MFRRKGLFWYGRKQRFFDWSTAFTGGVFGPGDPYLSGRIKNRYKKSHLIPPNSGLIRSHLSSWIHHYPKLNGYRFFMISDLDLLQICNLLYITSEPWESQHDLLLAHLMQNTHISQEMEMVTDNSLIYAERPIAGSWLYLNTAFPVIPFYDKFFDNTEEGFSGIVVGGQHPFGIRGEKLLLLRPELVEEFPFLSTNKPNLWHLSIYGDGVKHYYDLLKRKGFSLKEKEWEKTLSRIEEWAEQEGRSIEIHPAPLPFQAKLILKKKNGSLFSIGDSFDKNRVFYKDLTILALEGESQITFHIRLPLNFTHTHLAHKWKGLTEMFAQL